MEIKGIENLVFSGGGLKGWCYIGVLRALKEYNVYSSIKNIAGSSIGSIFGIFFALDIDYSLILEKIMDKPPINYADMDLNNILNNQSLFKGQLMENFIREVIETKVSSNITFKELYDLTKINCILSTICITNQQVEYFSKDITPDNKVIDGILASCAMPIALPPVKINNKFYYDGGICDPFPTHLFDESKTVGFNLCFNEMLSNDSGIKIVDLLYTLSKLVCEKYSNDKQYIVYDFKDICENVETLNLCQTKDDIFTFYKKSYYKTKDSLYNDFLALPST